MAITLVKSPNQYSYSRDPMFFTLETSLMSGIAPYNLTEENLSCYIEVWEKLANGSEVLLAKKNTRFNRYTKRADFSVGNMVSPAVGLPTFNGAFGSADMYGVAESRLKKIFIKYGEQYGFPSELQALTQTDDVYYIVPGSSDQTIGTPVNGGFGCYDSKKGGVQGVAQEVGDEQYDWMYFVLDGSTSVDVTFVYTDKDGNNHTVVKPYVFAAAPNICFVSTGPADISLPLELVKSDVVSYVVSISNGGNAFMSKTYVIDQLEVADSREVLVDTYLGGYETLRMKGGYAMDSAAAHAGYRHNDFAGSTIELGSVDIYDHEEWDVYHFRSGYYSQAYIFYMRRALLRPVWLIRAKSTGIGHELVKLIPTGSTVKSVVNDGGELFFISVSFKSAVIR